jgi:hypothetical protein
MRVADTIRKKSFSELGALVETQQKEIKDIAYTTAYI